MKSEREFLEKYEHLIQSLLSRTNKGELDWSLGSYSGEIECDLGRASVALELAESDDGSERLALRIRDQFGMMVDNIRPDDFLGKSENFIVSDMYILYRAARRSATNADHVLDELINNLKQGPE